MMELVHQPSLVSLGLSDLDFIGTKAQDFAGALCDLGAFFSQYNQQVFAHGRHGFSFGP